MIRSILLSEFHPTAGPKIAFQVPEDYITKEFFDAIHIYIITKPELQGRLITVNVLGHKIVGCPVCITNKKYARNALIFNLCFVFDASTQTNCYGSAVEKLAGYLTQLELEGEFLSNETKKEKIPQFMEEILSSLNKTGSCSMFMGESCTIHLKISPVIEDPQPVQDHDVPIFRGTKPGRSSMKWDLTTQQVIPYIDGFKHVARIAVEADVEINLVKACLQNLLHFNVISIISIFQYSNVYTSTEKIRDLVENQALQEECLQCISTKVHVKPIFRDVLVLYSSMTAGLTVKDICLRFNPQASKIDIKKLVQFGLKYNIIRRLHKYPLKLPESKHASLTKFNGTQSCDEICCKTGMSFAEMEEKLENDPSIIVCWK